MITCTELMAFAVFLTVVKNGSQTPIDPTPDAFYNFLWVPEKGPVSSAPKRPWEMTRRAAASVFDNSLRLP